MFKVLVLLLVLSSVVSFNRNNRYLHKQLSPQSCIHKVITKMSSTTTAAAPMIDLSPDGLIKKEILTRGTGKKIEAGDILAVEYYAKVAGQTIPFARGDKEQFIVKDGSLIKGWDIAISSMSIGEKARIEIDSQYAYGAKGIKPIIPSGANLEIQVKVLAWLGNQLQPESLFSKDLDIDPFIASTPESIQAEYDEMQINKLDKYKGSIVDIYVNRLKNISFGFGGSGFFVSQSGDKAPWYLNPNLTFPAMITFVLAAFLIVIQFGGVKEKGMPRIDPELASISTNRYSTVRDTSGADDNNRSLFS